MFKLILYTYILFIFKLNMVFCILFFMQYNLKNLFYHKQTETNSLHKTKYSFYIF